MNGINTNLDPESMANGQWVTNQHSSSACCYYLGCSIGSWKSSHFQVFLAPVPASFCPGGVSGESLRDEVGIIGTS